MKHTLFRCQTNLSCQLRRMIENTRCILPTQGTILSLVSLSVFQRTGRTEVVLASCDDRVSEVVPANIAGEREAIQVRLWATFSLFIFIITQIYRIFVIIALLALVIIIFAYLLTLLLTCRNSRFSLTHANITPQYKSLSLLFYLFIHH